MEEKMGRAIDAEQIIQRAKDDVEAGLLSVDTFVILAARIENAPTIKYAAETGCAWCKHYAPGLGSFGACTLKKCDVFEDDFCSRAEKK